MVSILRAFPNQLVPNSLKLIVNCRYITKYSFKLEQDFIAKHKMVYEGIKKSLKFGRYIFSTKLLPNINSSPKYYSGHSEVQKPNVRRVSFSFGDDRPSERTFGYVRRRSDAFGKTIFRSETFGKTLFTFF